MIHSYCPECVIHIVSNIHDSSPVKAAPCSGRSGILFVGSLPHLPNQQAVTHLLHDVLPIILKHLPVAALDDFKINIVGGTNEVPPKLQKLFDEASPHVQYHGWLSEDMLAMLYNKVRVVVAPLLSGAGVKGKVSGSNHDQVAKHDNVGCTWQLCIQQVSISFALTRR